MSCYAPVRSSVVVRSVVSVVSVLSGCRRCRLESSASSLIFLTCSPARRHAWPSKGPESVAGRRCRWHWIGLDWRVIREPVYIRLCVACLVVLCRDGPGVRRQPGNQQVNLELRRGEVGRFGGGGGDVVRHGINTSSLSNLEETGSEDLRLNAPPPALLLYCALQFYGGLILSLHTGIQCMFYLGMGLRFVPGILRTR